MFDTPMSADFEASVETIIGFWNLESPELREEISQNLHLEKPYFSGMLCIVQKVSIGPNICHKRFHEILSNKKL